MRFRDELARFRGVATGILAAALIPVCIAFGQDNQAAGGQETNALSKTVKKPGTLSDFDLAQLKTEWTDEKTKIVFTASVNQPKLSEADKKRLVKSKKTPIRITADLIEMKPAGGKTLTKRLNGTAYLYLVDSDGKVVLTQSVALEKMCPT